MKSYIASPLEVKAAIDGTLRNLFIPVKYYTEKDKWGVVSQTSQKPPPYAPDSIIYFREAWNYTDPQEAVPGEFMGAETGWVGCQGEREIRWRWVYKASSAHEHLEYGKARWKPSPTMPREAARIYVKAGNPTAELRDGIWGWFYPVTIISTTGLNK